VLEVIKEEEPEPTLVNELNTKEDILHVTDSEIPDLLTKEMHLNLDKIQDVNENALVIESNGKVENLVFKGKISNIYLNKN
jgi:hypothetical protein